MRENKSKSKNIIPLCLLIALIIILAICIPILGSGLNPLSENTPKPYSPVSGYPQKNSGNSTQINPDEFLYSYDFTTPQPIARDYENPLSNIQSLTFEPDFDFFVKREMPEIVNAVVIFPEIDYFKKASDSKETIKDDINQILAKSKLIGLNSIVLSLPQNDPLIIFNDKSRFDILSYFTTSAEKFDISTILLYDFSVPHEGINDLDFIYSQIGQLSTVYNISAIILGNYIPDDDDNQQYFREYMASASGMGFEAFAADKSQNLVSCAYNTVKALDPDIKVGIAVTDSIANLPDSDNKRKILDAIFQNKNADFLLIDSFSHTSDENTNFERLTGLWNEAVNNAGIPFYINFPYSKLCDGTTDGFQSPDQILLQITAANQFENFAGSIFDSFTALSDNKQNSTDVLSKMLRDEFNASMILTELSLTSPAEPEFTTEKRTALFSGASDPNFPILINKIAIETDENGFFAHQLPLDIGQNTITIEHKGKSFDYLIRREVLILDTVSPADYSDVVSGSSLKVSAVAYQDTVVTASLNDMQITLEETRPHTFDEDAAEYSDYVVYEGFIQLPETSENMEKLGTLIFRAEWDGKVVEKEGATITVFKKLDLGAGTQIRITADSADTYPVDTLDNLTTDQFHPLPKGTLDKTISDELSYSSGNDTFKYYILNSGVRIKADDIEILSERDLTQNNISKASVTSNGDYTYLLITTDWAVPYTVDLTGTYFNIDFKYSTHEQNGLMDTNPLFSNVSWNGTTLYMQLSDKFYGYKAYYNDKNQLVFRFNNPKTSLSGMRIAIDPGHSAKDPGALGFYPAFNEALLNRQVAQKVADILRNNGADVLLIDTSKDAVSLEQRASAANSFNAQMLISVHHNTSASNPNASGTECYYFTPFSKNLAKSIASNIAFETSFINRGEKNGHFYITRSFQYPSVLVECGFISNIGEYNELISDSTQSEIARGIVVGIENYYGIN